MFALEQHTRYLRELRLGDRVTIRVRALGRSDKRIHFLLLMQRDQLVSTSELVGTHIDLTERRAAPFPLEVARAIDEIVCAHAHLGWEPPVCGVMRP